MAGFLGLLKKALPHFADAENVLKAAKKDGAKGAAVAVVRALLDPGVPDVSQLEDAAIANAAAIDDQQGDIEELRGEIKTLRGEIKTLQDKTAVLLAEAKAVRERLK